ncbi:MAG: hypothetical protein A3J74_00940 [Elusimicrobia bacterium RIFCSPHIGHO2_02_FULL_57_9]|nr:MAG: hypothetical protein A3J74_00940 [Elusimicrobia bacterium RIFCSPHIGHO2_02_FULL_57_9]
MRILHLHDETWDSGISHYALTVACALQKKGHQVYFWAPMVSHSIAKARHAGLIARDVDFPWFYLHSLRCEIKKAKIELMNAHTGSTQSAAVALSLGLNIPVLRTRGDIRPVSANFLSRALASKTRGFIAPNDAIRNQLSAAFPQARVELIFQGIPSPIDVLPMPKAPVIGLLARLDEVKGHETWLDAVMILRQQFPHARFLAAGGGSPEKLSRFRWQVDALGLKGVVDFLGHVVDPWAFMARCRIGVVASTDSEAVCRAALEWMAMGRPLVATAVGCLPDLLADNQTGLLIAPNDAPAMAKALLRLLENPQTADEFGVKGKQRFEQLFSVSRFADLTEKFYEESLRNIPPRR